MHYEKYRRYNLLFMSGIFLMLSGVLISVLYVSSDINFPMPISGMYVVFSMLGGLVICIFCYIQYARFYLKGYRRYNETERRLLGKASFYGVIITMILSIVSIYVIDYLQYELTTRTLIMIPITILAVSISVFFQYFKRKKTNH